MTNHRDEPARAPRGNGRPSCGDYEETLSAYVLGELDVLSEDERAEHTTRADLEAHLESCERCREEVALLRRTIEAVAQASAAPAADDTAVLEEGLEPGRRGAVLSEAAEAVAVARSSSGAAVSGASGRGESPAAVIIRRASFALAAAVVVACVVPFLMDEPRSGAPSSGPSASSISSESDVALLHESSGERAGVRDAGRDALAGTPAVESAVGRVSGETRSKRKSSAPVSSPARGVAGPGEGEPEAVFRLPTPDARTGVTSRWSTRSSPSGPHEVTEKVVERGLNMTPEKPDATVLGIESNTRDAEHAEIVEQAREQVWRFAPDRQVTTFIVPAIPGADGITKPVDDRILLKGGGTDGRYAGAEPAAPSAEILTPPGGSVERLSEREVRLAAKAPGQAASEGRRGESAVEVGSVEFVPENGSVYWGRSGGGGGHLREGGTVELGPPENAGALVGGYESKPADGDTGNAAREVTRLGASGLETRGGRAAESRTREEASSRPVDHFLTFNDATAESAAEPSPRGAARARSREVAAPAASEASRKSRRSARARYARPTTESQAGPSPESSPPAPVERAGQAESKDKTAVHLRLRMAAPVDRTTAERDRALREQAQQARQLGEKESVLYSLKDLEKLQLEQKKAAEVTHLREQQQAQQQPGEALGLGRVKQPEESELPKLALDKLEGKKATEPALKELALNTKDSESLYKRYVAAGEAEEDDRNATRSRSSSRTAVDPHQLVEEYCRRLAPRPGETPDMMFFRYWGTNPFVEANVDNQSTFAVDVDTASYTLLRKYLTDRGVLPPREAIRTEEFLNYFKYDYPPPPEGRAFAVHTEMAPSPFGHEPEYQLLKVGIKGREVARGSRKPCALVFVIDTSGSMRRESRLELVKDGLRLLVREVDEGDTIGIVAFDREARTILEPTPADRKEKVLDAISTLQPRRNTNVDAGLRMGYEMAARNLERRVTHRVILLSDGVANTGVTDVNGMLSNVQAHRRRGIFLTCVGVGMGNHNDTLLEQLADRSDGQCVYVDRLEEAQKVFVENLTGTLETIARDVKIQVEFDKEKVLRYRLLGYENRAVADSAFRDDTVDAGEVGAGHEVTAVYELKCVPGADGSIATVRVRHLKVDSREPVELEHVVDTSHRRGTYADTSPRFKLSALAGEFAEILRGSYWARGSDLSRVAVMTQDLLGESGMKLGSDPEVVELAALMFRAVPLLEARQKSEGELAQVVDALKENTHLRTRVETLRLEETEENAQYLRDLQRQNEELRRRLERLLDRR